MKIRPLSPFSEIALPIDRLALEIATFVTLVPLRRVVCSKSTVAPSVTSDSEMFAVAWTRTLPVAKFSVFVPTTNGSAKKFSAATASRPAPSGRWPS